MMVMVQDVAQHQRGALEPRRDPQGAEVRLHDEVAVALFPVRELIARHRLHVHIVGEQIVAGMGFLVRAVDEEARLESLAHEPTKLIREAHQHGVQAAVRNAALELIERDQPLHVCLLPGHRRITAHPVVMPSRARGRKA